MPETSAFKRERAGMGPKFVVEVCRHGDRTPITVFPTDPWPISTWELGAGQLTPAGEAAHYLLGELLRKRYNDTIPWTYEAWSLKVRSTDVDRCLMSAESQLAGIFPPGTGASDALPYEWQAVPIHTEPIGYDAVLRAFDHAHCPRYDQIMTKRKESKAFADKEKAHSEFFETISRLAGMKISLANIFVVSDTMVCERAHGRPWVEGMTDELFEEAVQLSGWTMAQMFAPGPEERHAHEIARLTAGNLVQEMLDSISRVVVENQTAPFFQLYSAHDTTLAALLTALNAFDGISPPYNSTFVLELWELDADEGSDLYEHGVRAFYNWKPLVLPGCTSSDACTLKNFLGGVHSIAVESEAQWAAECIVLEPSGSTDTSAWMTALVGLSTFILGACVAFVVLKAPLSRKSQSSYEKMEEPGEIDLQPPTEGASI